jgi:hypothetical protein
VTVTADCHHPALLFGWVDDSWAVIVGAEVFAGVIEPHAVAPKLLTVPLGQAVSALAPVPDTKLPASADWHDD